MTDATPPPHVEAAAAALEAATRTRTPVEPLTKRFAGLTVQDAYDIQRMGIAARIAAGARVVGHKVGLTSEAMQRMLGVDQPDYGVLLDDMVIAPDEGIDSARLIAPRIEAEIAFDLTRPLAGASVTAADVLAATGTVRPALEVIDSRIADWRITFEDTVADNASSAAVVLGAPVQANGPDLAVETVEMQVGDATSSGRGDAVLGHPAEAVAWLVRTLASFGEGLDEGEVVMPGAVSVALPIAAGDVITATWSSLGQIVVAVR
jgi:2-keto-4-pentenoate hydratase